MSRLIGADDLKRRLSAVSDDAPRAITRRWAKDAAAGIRSQVPVRTGAGRASVQGSSDERGAKITARFYVGILDRGAKAHSIAPRGQALKFPVRGRTVYASRVQNRGQVGRRFALDESREALDKGGADEIVRSWNGAA